MRPTGSAGLVIGGRCRRWRLRQHVQTQLSPKGCRVRCQAAGGPILAKMAAGTPVRILLVRHGETVFNVEGRWQGQSDSPLTERGLAQARELARALAEVSIAAIYSSDLGRAIDTATGGAKRQ